MHPLCIRRFCTDFDRIRFEHCARAFRFVYALDESIYIFSGTFRVWNWIVFLFEIHFSIIKSRNKYENPI